MSSEIPPSPQPPHVGQRRLLVLGLAVAVAAIGALAYTGKLPLGKGAVAKGGADGGAGERIVPVRTATVQVTDFPIYLDGLGSATAYETITVKTLVDGTMEKVAFVEGQQVKKGQLLAQIDDRTWVIQKEQAEGSLARDEANLKESQLNLDRYTELAAKKLIPDQQRDDQASTVNQLKGTILLDKAQIDAAQLQITYAHIVAPTDGVTGVRIVDPGNVVHAADPNGLVVLTKLDPIALLFTMSQDYLPQVAEAMATGPLTVEAFNRDGTEKLGEGTLLLIDNQINATTATIRLKAILPNPEHKLWPNQFVKARLQLSVHRDAKVIPNAAVQTGPTGQFVYLVDAANTAQVRPVKVGLVQGDQVIIASGLNGGEIVVTDGQNQLKPGAKVSLSPSAGSPPPAKPATSSHAEGGTTGSVQHANPRAGLR